MRDKLINDTRCRNQTGEEVETMFLGQLALSGFKSYSERVQIDFAESIAVIIGSNGVGKSNALNAIVWALGEDDCRSLRCSNPRDWFLTKPYR